MRAKMKDIAREYWINVFRRKSILTGGQFLDIHNVFRAERDALDEINYPIRGEAYIHTIHKFASVARVLDLTDKAEILRREEEEDRKIEARHVAGNDRFYRERP